MDENIKVRFTGDASSIEAASKQASAALEGVSEATVQVSQSLGQASAKLAQNAAKMGGSLDHVANRSTTARFAVQNLSNVVRDIPFGINNPAIFSTALDHVVASMTMLKQEAAAMNAATGSSQTAFGLLKQSLAGGGGLLIGFNLVSLAATTLIPKLFETGTAAETQAKKLQEAKKVVEDYISSLDDVSQARVKGLQSAQEELVKLSTLYKATQDANIPLAERKKLVDELQEQYPKYFKNISDEIILAGGAATAYNNLSTAIIASAKARAAQDALVDIQKQLLALDQQYAASVGETAKAQQKLKGILQGNDKIITATTDEFGNIVGSVKQSDVAQSQLNAKLKIQNDLLKQRTELEQRAKSLANVVSRTVEQNPEALLNPTGSIKAAPKKEDKFSFLFDFLPFNPNGTLKPEQKNTLLEAVDKFQKEFGTILQGAIFTGTEDQRIAQAKTLDLQIKAGNVKFDVASFKEAFSKLNKDSDIIPKDALDGLSASVVDQFIRGFQNESERVKGLNLFGDLTRTFDQQVDLFKTQVLQAGQEIPKSFEGINIHGIKQQFSLNDLFDRNKIDDKEALAALQRAFGEIKDKTFELGKELNKALNDTVASIQVEGLSAIGESIAAALTGSNIGDAFKAFEQMLGGAVESLGKQIIALNVAALAAKNALKLTFTNPAIGIAAGAALVFVGAALKKLAGGGIKGFAQGGIVPGSGNGDTVPAMLTPGEFVVTKKWAPFAQMLFGGGVPRISNSMMGFATGGLVPARAIDNSSNAVLSRVEHVPYIAGFDISHDKVRLMIQRANQYGNKFGR
jgi:hypothetical protein